MAWGSPEEVERRNRIRLSVWAYAYEMRDDPLVDDARYDELSYQIDPQQTCGNPTLDKFFRGEFVPHSGVWVRKHPDQRGLERLYRRLKCYFSSTDSLSEPTPNP